MPMVTYNICCSCTVMVCSNRMTSSRILFDFLKYESEMKSQFSEVDSSQFQITQPSLIMVLIYLQQFVLRASQINLFKVQIEKYIE